MENTTIVGKTGEQLASQLLESKGYAILCQNFRCGRKEIDIVAAQENLIVFVEVKLRKNNYFGYPEQSVSLKKQENIRIVAEHYLYTYAWKGNIRFDIIAIIKQKTNTEIVHFEDAF